MTISKETKTYLRISGFILCLLLLSATACGQGSDDNPDGKTSSMTPADTDDRDRTPVAGSVKIGPDVDVMAELRESDTYQLETGGDDAPVIENDTLTLKTSYGGGCGTNEFTLVTDGDFMGSDPVRLVVALTHDDNDPCEAIEQESYSFDLTEIKDAYHQEAYETDEDSITLRLRHLEGYSRSVDPDPLDLDYTFAP